MKSKFSRVFSLLLVVAMLLSQFIMPATAVELPEPNCNCDPAERDGVWLEKVPATCKNNAYNVYQCKSCELKYAEVILEEGPTEDGHKYDVVVAEVAATCYASGTTAVLKCAYCGNVKDAETIPAHTHTDNYYKVETDLTDAEKFNSAKHTKVTTCDVCKNEDGLAKVLATEESLHNWIKVDELPVSCKEPDVDGWIKYVCADCDETVEVSVKNATKHNLVLTENKLDPTCTEPGWIEYRCTDCEYVTKDVIPATGHSFTTDIVIGTNPTCDADGNKAVKQCKDCGVYDDDGVYHEADIAVSEAKQAKSDAYVALEEAKKALEKAEKDRDDAQAAYDGEDGLVTKQNEAQDAYDAAVEAREKAQAAYDKAKEARDKAVVADKAAEKEEAEAYDAYDKAKKTYNSYKSKKNKDARDAALYAYNIAKAAHADIAAALERAKAALATAEDVLADAKDDVDAKGYALYVAINNRYDTYGAYGTNDWKFTRQMNILNGIINACTEAKNKAQNDYDSTVSDYDMAVEARTATVRIPALGHDFVKNVVEATCSTDGRVDYTCTRCPVYYLESTTPANPKWHVPIITKDAVAATCISTGLTHEVKCNVCKQILAKQEVTKINPDNHVHTEVIPAVPATNDKAGTTEGLKCSDCGTIIENPEEDPIIDEKVKFKLVAKGINGSERAVNSGYITLQVVMSVESENARIYGLNYGFSFDNSRLTYLGGEGNQFANAQYCDVDQANESGFIIFTQDMGLGKDKTFEKNDYVLATFTFKVEKYFDWGMVDFLFDLWNTAIARDYENYGNSFFMEFDWNVTIGIDKLGDINHDDNINSFDVMELSKWFAEADEDDYEQVFDMNKDGYIDGDDFVLLRSAVVLDDSYLDL